LRLEDITIARMRAALDVLARHVRHARRAFVSGRATTKASTTKAAFGREHEAHEAN
jgi:hypothetical protein